MEGKLIKTSKDSHHNGHYFLNDSDGFAIGSTDKDWCKRAVSKRPLYILSLKNCEAIKNGYDLDELVSERLSTRFNENSGYHKFVFVEAYKEGFLKAMEIIGDKKFDEFLDREKELGISDIKTIERIQWYYKTYFDKSQQTEWDVEIEMIGPLVYPANLPKEGEERPDYRPKLDENGYLILKRK